MLLPQLDTPKKASILHKSVELRSNKCNNCWAKNVGSRCVRSRGFDRFQTLRNNSQQRNTQQQVKGCANGRKCNIQQC